MEIALLLIGLLAFLGGGFLLGKTIWDFTKNDKVNNLDKKGYLFLGGGCLIIALAALFIILGADLGCFAEQEISSIDYSLQIVGSLFFGFCFAGLWTSFFINHYKVNKEEKFSKTIKILEGCFIGLSVVFFLLMMEGVASYMTYPLYNGIAINGSGIHLYTVENEHDSTNSGGLHIAFYAIFILLGFLVAYLISDSKIAKEYGKHGILDSLGIWAFIAGIVGARAWYVVGNWEIDFAAKVAEGDWMSIFEVWNGGLTIIGGAALGMIVGITYALFKRPYIHIRLGMDMIIPTILLAQFIGRWGNFFNLEVYGTEVSGEYWSWLPTWIYNQMAVAAEVEGNIVVPLFLVEGLINLAGYFIIVKLVPLIWKKHRGLGSLAGLYLFWYGIVRMILEPLRASTYNMGVDGMWSVWNSMAYFIVGAILIVYFTLYDEFNLRERWFNNYNFCKKVKIFKNLGGEKWLVEDGKVIPLALVQQIQAEAQKEEEPQEESSEKTTKKTTTKKTTSKKSSTKKEETTSAESVSLEENKEQADNSDTNDEAK